SLSLDTATGKKKQRPSPEATRETGAVSKSLYAPDFATKDTGPQRLSRARTAPRPARPWPAAANSNAHGANRSAESQRVRQFDWNGGPSGRWVLSQDCPQPPGASRARLPVVDLPVPSHPAVPDRTPRCPARENRNRPDGDV